MKKHITQMNEVEIDLLINRVNSTDIASVEITKYAVKRFNERFEGITLLDVAKVFLNYELIEFNTQSNDGRVLIRGKDNVKTDSGCFNVCLVYSVKNNRIITAWIEDWQDNHDTLRIEEYSEDLEISW